MYVITADQVDSRTTDDIVGATLAGLNKRDDLLLPAERTAGDELQLLTAHAGTALDIILALSRAGRWSIGCGVGEVRRPLPATVREASGDAFVAARDAVDRAKRKSTRFALGGAGHAGRVGHAEALIDLLLVVRARRTDEGWELADLIAGGLTQAAAAARLGISPQAASQRARAAELRVEQAAVPALIAMLEGVGRLDDSTRGGSS